MSPGIESDFNFNSEFEHHILKSDRKIVKIILYGMREDIVSFGFALNSYVIDHFTEFDRYNRENRTLQAILEVNPDFEPDIAIGYITEKIIGLN